MKGVENITSYKIKKLILNPKTVLKYHNDYKVSKTNLRDIDKHFNRNKHQKNYIHRNNPDRIICIKCYKNISREKLMSIRN